MARQTITPQSVGSAWPTALTALTWTAADATNFEQLAVTNRDILLIWNSHASTAYTVTIDPVTDPVTGRTVTTLSAVSVAAGGFKMIGPLAMEGFRNSSGYLTFQAENAAIKYAVIRNTR